ncbi:hypothetical protein RAJCM14343_2496 [Rhodococcus aetherivorans]|jgi:hypothetical protein|uniref:Uncharacterized protein n=1 Tax=Rhodococcus aetherivorans TaxID=191292 RepID=A0ABQ0YL75_9NOCA|nr:hypothetical protein RAJCM14343_2496 [Rhodococcus aetherivorans]CCW15614.1 hypothetical protein EBESD8_61910 [Rhodococcus aetherivorans]
MTLESGTDKFAVPTGERPDLWMNRTPVDYFFTTRGPA